MNEKLSITLPSELVAIVQEQVNSGRYGSISEVVRDALERQNWDERDTEQGIAFMRERIQHSLANPTPTLTVAETRAHMKAFVSKLYKDR